MTARQSSPLDPYAESPVTPEEPLHVVRLLRVPVRILDAGRRHHDELMHEFSLLAVADTPADGVPKRMLELIDTLGHRYAGTSAEPDAAVDAALSRGDATVDLTYEVAAHVVEAADHLAALMDEADEFCKQEQMLTLQRSEVVKEFTTWYLDEFRRQIAGEQPHPWEGPLDP